MIRKQSLFSGIIAFLLVFVFVSCTHAQIQKKDKSDFEKFFTALNIIKYAYVDSVHGDELVEDAIVSMLRDLDPHSTYFSKTDIKEANEPLEGNFEGVGIQFQLYKDTILVVAAIPGGPSDKAGILAGDKIVSIDGENATGKKLTTKYVREHLRGKKGTKVRVGIKRGSRKKILDFKITRDKIPLNSVNAYYMIDDKIGYVKLDRFSKKSAEEINDAIDALKKQNMEHLILDLRNNSGGMLGAAIDISDIFIDSEKLLVYTEGLRAPLKEFKSGKKGAFEEGKLIILINEGSASASEIVSGAVQDWDRGIIVGRRSFGKGLVQRPFLLPDSSVIRLTTSRYHTPSGRCIQKPYDEGSEEYYMDLYKRLKNGELNDEAAIHFPDSLKYFTNNKRIVYGGGGIMPDIFVPWDSTKYSDYYTELIRKGVLNEFVTDLLDKQRNEFTQKYTELNSYIENYNFDEQQMKAFLNFAVEKGVPTDETGYATSKEQIALVLKALLARNLFNISAYFDIIGTVDPEINKALELMYDEDAFKILN